jgi:hypothetical protein
MTLDCLPRPVRLLVLASLGLVLGTLAPNANAARPGEIVLGTILPSGTEQYRLLQELGQRWRRERGQGQDDPPPDGRQGQVGHGEKIGIGQIAPGFSAWWGCRKSVRGGRTSLMPLTFQTGTKLTTCAKLRPILEQTCGPAVSPHCAGRMPGGCGFSPLLGGGPDDYRATGSLRGRGRVQIAMMKSVGSSIALKPPTCSSACRPDDHAAPLPPMVALAGSATRRRPCSISNGVLSSEPPSCARLGKDRSRCASSSPRPRRPRNCARGRLEDEEAVRAMQKHGLKVTFPATAGRTGSG